MGKMLPFCVATALALAIAVGAAGANLSAQDASRHIGETATVCGTVAGARYVRGIRGQPTFINLDHPYPNPVFTVVVWGTYREEFDPPPETWRGRLCVTGRIRAYRGTPEIVVIDPAQVAH